MASGIPGPQISALGRKQQFLTELQPSGNLKLYFLYYVRSSGEIRSRNNKGECYAYFIFIRLDNLCYLPSAGSFMRVILAISLTVVFFETIGLWCFFSGKLVINQPDYLAQLSERR
jgi:hypothetical protein